MRNLKRVLSLALACVMVIGMMVMTTGAADFSDAAEIEYTEAVDVMSALGVLGGYTVDGETVYNPGGELTRDQAAKIIAYMLLGKTTADKLVGTGMFDDVPATMWSAGYVEYCANLGIVSGWNNNFAPGEKLMTVQFGKMLLCALGYDAKVEGYNNDNWASNIALDMIELGLDFEGLDLSGYLTREQAAQMAFQALTKTMVKYETKGTSITVGGVEITSGASAAEARTDVNKVDVEGTLTEVDYTGTADGELQFCEKYFPNLTKGIDSDAYNRPGYSWTVTKPVGDPIEVFVGSKALATYTVPTKAEDIAKTFPADKWTVGLFTADAIEALTAYGTTVEVYGNPVAKTITRVVTIAEQLGKVTKVTEAKGETPRYVTVAGMPFVTEDFAKDDIVLYTVNNAGDEIVTMAAPETFTGKVESYNDTLGTVTIGGETYFYGHDFALTKNFKKNYTFTQYSDGSIAAQAEVQTATAVSKDYVYVVKTECEVADNSSLITSTAAAAKAQVIFTDGTAGTIDLNIFKDAQNSYAVSVQMPAASGAVAKKTLAWAKENDGAVCNWFAYKTNDDGTYTLSAINAKYAAVIGDTVLVEDTMKVINGKSTTKDTAITYVDNATPTVVTNMAGFVDLTLEGSANEILITYAGADATTISAIYAIEQAPIVVADTADYAYAVKAGNVIADGTEWTFSIKGELATYIIADGQSVTAGNVYTLTENVEDTTKDNYLVSDPVSMTGNALVTVIDGDQVAISNGTVLTLSDKVNVYNVDDTAEVVGEAKTLAVGDVVNYIVAGGKVTNIWVYGVDGTVEVETAAELVAAVANEPVGITILVAEGTYALASRVSLTKDVTIVADGDVVLSGSDSDSILNLNTAGVDVVIKGVKFESKGGIGHYGILVDSLADGTLKIQDCYFTTDSADNGSGVNVSGYPTVTIENCTFDNVKRGICVDAPNIWDNITVKGNIFTGIEYAGVRTDIRAFGTTVNKTEAALKATLLGGDNAGLTETLIKISDNYS